MAVLAKDSKECEEKAASENDEKKAKFAAILCARKMQKRLAQVEGVTVASVRDSPTATSVRDLPTYDEEIQKHKAIKKDPT